MTNTDLMNEQALLEERMATLGIERYQRLAKEARDRGEASRSTSMNAVIDAALDQLSEAVQNFCMTANSGRAGRRNATAVHLTDIPYNLSAFVTVKIVVDGITQDQALTATALRIGTALETELRSAEFAKNNPAYFATVERDLNSRTRHVNHRRAVVNHMFRQIGDDWEAWSSPVKLRMGIKLLELLATSTGLIEFQTARRGRKTTTLVSATDRFKDWLYSLDSKYALLDPEFLPCVVPPKDWESITEGGYHTDALAYPPKLVKTWSRAHTDELLKADLTKVYRAVNAIQRTPWAVNAKVLDVARALVEQGREVAGLPAMDDIPLPTLPLDVDTNEDALNSWKREAARTYESNRSLVGKRVGAYKTLALAEDFKDYEAIYFPHQLDFRGRVYPIPQMLNPQGADLAKGLLQFAEGDALTDSASTSWFLIHGANSYGIDDVSFDDRKQWVLDNQDNIIATAKNPLDFQWWADADKPFVFLAWCFEYVEWVFHTEPGGFVSHLPIAMDGSCNGIQHYSAMLRDPRGGEATNLTPSDKPQDLYKEVAVEVNRKIAELAKGEGDDADLAKRWSVHHIDREITKRPVMVLPYGGTLNSCQKYVYEQATARLDHGFTLEELSPAANWLSGRVWESIGSVVVAARLAMGWLRDTTSIVSRENLPMIWTTPIGFPVVQAYPKTTLEQINTTLYGKRIQPALRTTSDTEIDRRRQANGIAPNFVHSLDASALMATVNEALDRGVTKFAMIHDSYGTTAGKTDTLATALRDAFVGLYEDNDVLENFLNDAVPAHLRSDVQSPPFVGGLDLKGVRQSPYFFA